MDYLNKNNRLDFQEVTEVTEASSINGKETETKYIVARSKNFAATSEGSIRIKTTLVEHHQKEGITFNQQIKGEEEEDEGAQVGDDDVPNPETALKA